MENRYDKYKDSGIAWIGEIPEHWEIRKLKNIFLLSTGTTPKEYDKISEGDNLINWYTPSDILEGCNDLFSSLRKLSERVIYENKISLFPIGTLLYVGIGASAGKVGYANENGYSNQQITGLIPLECYSRFYFYYLSVLKDKIRDNAFFTTLPIINNVYLGQELLPYPLLSEQQSIANYLDQKCGEIDELITLQEEMITKLQSYKQSVITEAVTKGLNKNVPLKDSGIEWIGEIPEHWICTVFKKFLSEPMQYGANEPAEECNYNDPRYIRITDIKDDGTLRDHTFKSLPLEKAKEYMLTKGDLLFARSGATVGKTFLYKEDYAACFAGYLIKARCNKNELLPNFIFYYTLSNAYQNWKNSIFIQSTIQNIGADKYSVMPIIAPPLSEQQSIANYLDQKCSEIDELISIKQQKIEKLKDYKKSLIFECVTGKRKV
ncbi:restriction endonuclease subunit S [Bacteroides caecigallinarum]|uniref:restriction endonuclease subunit S n=1 Tax=Bacteroides caecigallinarum TaxID=1411144 RepID=UPI0019594C16|nr:restriction endonuclease subunit S [Bacteroides caecigallinarum]MBM6864123.1 restriction endonuclease subunit S [Bacteroides caecigallinarum]